MIESFSVGSAPLLVRGEVIEIVKNDGTCITIRRPSILRAVYLRIRRIFKEAR